MATDAFVAFGAGVLTGFIFGVMTAAILAAIANKIDREDHQEEENT